MLVKDNLVAQKTKALRKKLFDLGLPYIDECDWYVFPNGKKIALSDVVDVDIIVTDIGNMIGKRSIEAGITAEDLIKIKEANKIIKKEPKFSIEDFHRVEEKINSDKDFLNVL